MEETKQEQKDQGAPSARSTTRTIRYHAYARQPDGRIGQLLVTRERTPGGPAPTRRVSQEWTGVTYRNEREARADMERLNCEPRA